MRNQAPGPTESLELAGIEALLEAGQEKVLLVPDVLAQEDHDPVQERLPTRFPRCGAFELADELVHLLVLLLHPQRQRFPLRSEVAQGWPQHRLLGEGTARQHAAAEETIRLRPYCPKSVAGQSCLRAIACASSCLSILERPLTSSAFARS